ncbi:hypothetical protein Fmac_006855 [Flemingia macrophylla]|uniref:DYW domain-containing protein n=1 Tax=Flemingia macrophylla TaxID=520843 RepID=A0ABD1NBS5_9FABA
MFTAEANTFSQMSLYLIRDFGNYGMFGSLVIEQVEKQIGGKVHGGDDYCESCKQRRKALPKALVANNNMIDHTLIYILASSKVVYWTTLISQLSHFDNPSRALTSFNLMRRTAGIYPNQFTFSAILPPFPRPTNPCPAPQTRLPIRLGRGHRIGRHLYFRAIEVLKELLQKTKLFPDQVTFSSVLSACAGMVQLGFGKQLHGSVVKRGLVGFVYVKNSLVDMYCKCGVFQDATKLFCDGGDRDVITWNVIIMECAHGQNFEQACLQLFHGYDKGRRGTRCDFVILSSSSFCNSLVTMYGKCGSLLDAYRVFGEAKDRNVVCWTAMIAVFHQHGCGNEAIELFEEMLREGAVPEYITFVFGVVGLQPYRKVDDGCRYFNSMTNVHCIEPGLEHCACMVDLLGNHVLLSNIYTRHGMLEEADEVRRLMGINGVRKEIGCSWIDVKNMTFVFNGNDSVEGSEEQSLWCHSEKLTFGLLVLPPGSPVRIKKNLRTYGDCHTVMKFASEIFQKEIIVRDINSLKVERQGLVMCSNSSTMMNFSHFAKPAAMVKANLQSIGFTSTPTSVGIKNKVAAAAAILINHVESPKVESRGDCPKKSVIQNHQEDKASMLEEAIEYLKTRKLQLQTMSMGSGLYMPTMMLPPGIHMGPLSPIGVGMQMGDGNDRFPMIQIHEVPIAHVSVLHGMARSSNAQNPSEGEGLPMPMPHAPVFSFHGNL